MSCNETGNKVKQTLLRFHMVKIGLLQYVNDKGAGLYVHLCYNLIKFFVASCQVSIIHLISYTYPEFSNFNSVCEAVKASWWEIL